MDKMTRRGFLGRLAALGAVSGSAVLSAGACVPDDAAHARLPSAGPTLAAQVFSGPSLVVGRGKEPADLVRQVVQALGGMERFVRQGDNVIIKPNICVAYHTYEYAATTNPEVVGALVLICREAGAARVRVMDQPFGGTAQVAYERSGIQAAVEAAGGEMELMNPARFVEVEIPQGIDLKTWHVYGPVLEADVLINVPIAKHHNLARLTLGMKNLMGVILDRPTIHTNLGQRLADLASLLRPDLTIVDAVRILTAHGPSGGRLEDVRQMDTVIASPDLVAADAYATTLFDRDPSYLDYIRAGAQMGLGEMDLDKLDIEQIVV